MSLPRRLLLRASRSAWLADQLRHRAFFRRAVRRFLPGEDVDAALAAAAEFARAGIGSVLTQLGEQVTTRADAAAVREHYLRVLGQVRARRLPAQLSIKLTHLGLDVDRAACEQALDALVARARRDMALRRAPTRSTCCTAFRARPSAHSRPTGVWCGC